MPPACLEQPMQGLIWLRASRILVPSNRRAMYITRKSYLSHSRPSNSGLSRTMRSDRAGWQERAGKDGVLTEGLRWRRRPTTALNLSDVRCSRGVPCLLYSSMLNVEQHPNLVRLSRQVVHKYLQDVTNPFGQNFRHCCTALFPGLVEKLCPACVPQ